MTDDGLRLNNLLLLFYSNGHFLKTLNLCHVYKNRNILRIPKQKEYHRKSILWQYRLCHNIVGEIHSVQCFGKT